MVRELSLSRLKNRHNGELSVKSYLPMTVAVLFLISACSTLVPLELAPEALQQKITTQDLLQSGDRVKLVTADGKVHKLRVDRVDIDAGVIVGSNQNVVIADVIALETKEFSGGKTALLAAGSYTILLLIAVAIAPVLIL